MDGVTTNIASAAVTQAAPNPMMLVMHLLSLRQRRRADEIQIQRLQPKK
jgi:hypothetical protein